MASSSDELSVEHRSGRFDGLVNNLAGLLVRAPLTLAVR